MSDLALTALIIALSIGIPGLFALGFLIYAHTLPDDEGSE